MAPPGRLGDSQSSLATDPRTHRGLLRGLEAYGMQHNTFLTADDLKADASLAEIVAFAYQSEDALERMTDGMNFSSINHPWSERSIVQTTTYITGVDDNPIRLIIYRPDNRPPNEDERLPAVLYFHGGAMVMLKAENRLHTTYAEAMAQMGMVAIIVDFRNVLGHQQQQDATTTTSTTTSLNHFPAGLEDCVFVAKWVHQHKSDLRVDKIILHGDSGGGNLVLATALQLSMQGDGEKIDGVFAIDPYISGAYDESQDWKREHIPSLAECDGYDVSCSSCSIYARMYDAQGKHRKNPLAWPYWASESEMRGLPPHLIAVAELDPLRDEGIDYGRRLVQAGVRAVGRVRLGMSHTGDLLLREYVPDEFLELLVTLKGFVDRL